MVRVIKSQQELATTVSQNKADADANFDEMRKAIKDLQCGIGGGEVARDLQRVWEQAASKDDFEKLKKEVSNQQRAATS